MRQILKWTEHKSSILIGSDTGSNLIDSAANMVNSHIKRQGINLTLETVEVEDRVADRCHMTGVKSFDALLQKNQGTFMTGNVYGDVQVSQYVRAANDLEVNGQSYPTGVLRQADAKFFQHSHGRLSNFDEVNRWLEKNENLEVIVYGFRNKLKKDQNHGAADWRTYGFLVTDPMRNLLFKFIDSNRMSSRVLLEAEHFVTNQHEGNSENLVEIKEGQILFMREDVQEALSALQQNQPTTQRLKT